MARARILIAVMAFACGDAAAQMYKCKGPDGKVVYSDTKCEASQSGDALKVTPMGTTKSEREKSMEQAAADKAEADRKAAAAAAERKALAKEVADEMRASGQGGSSAAPAQAAYQLTSADRDRIRELEQVAGSLGAYQEQKTAAQMQITRIKRGADAKMSSAEREKRDALMGDLVSTDKDKRARTLRELQQSYN
jgi:hypothetical protein